MSWKNMSSGEEKTPVGSTEQFSGEPETRAKAAETSSDREESSVDIMDKSFGDGKPRVNATDKSFAELESQTDNSGELVSQASTTDMSPGMEKPYASSADESSGVEKPPVNTVDNSLAEAESQVGTTYIAGHPESQIDTANYSSGEPQLQLGATNKSFADEKSELNDTGKYSDQTQSPASSEDKSSGEEHSDAIIIVKSSGVEKSQTSTSDKCPREKSQGNDPDRGSDEAQSRTSSTDDSPGAEVTQESPPAKPCEADVSQASLPAKPCEADVSQASPPAKPCEADVLQASPPAKPSEADVLQASPPAKPSEADMSQASPPAKPSEAEVSQASPPAKPSEAEVSQASPPAKPSEAEVSHVSPPAKPSEAEVLQASPSTEISEAEESQASPPVPQLKRRLLTYSGVGSKSPSSSGQPESQQIATVESGDLEPPSDTKEKAATNYLWMIIGGCVVFALGLALARSLLTQSGPPIPRDSALDIFFKEFASLKKDFPGQYEGLWFRSQKLLQKHLNMSEHSTPSILILTAARDGEKTLLCASQRLAKSYADSLSAKWILVYGPDESNSDSATSKMKMDDKLSIGFQSDSRAAVLYRLETLPSGSLLILYKYCDHENAAFKDVALVLTVLLEEQSLQTDLSFSEVEEKVKDFLWERFASSEVSAHNEMDVDKLSGVWSRISHVVLPVLPVESIENGVCPKIED